MVHIKKLNEMVNLELHSEAETKIRDIARTNTDCFEDCGEGMLSISLFNTNFNIPPRMRLYSYEVMVQVYPNDERDVYVVGYKENGENNWWALNQFTQKEQNDIVDAVQASVNKIKEGGMFSENRRTANARGRAVNESQIRVMGGKTLDKINRIAENIMNLGGTNVWWDSKFRLFWAEDSHERANYYIYEIKPEYVILKDEEKKYPNLEMRLDDLSELMLKNILQSFIEECKKQLTDDAFNRVMR